MAPATRSQARKTRSAGGNATLPSLDSEPARTKKTTGRKGSVSEARKRESPTRVSQAKEEESTPEVNNPEHTQKRQKLANGEPKAVINGALEKEEQKEESPAADSGKEPGSGEESGDVTPEESESKGQAGSGKEDVTMEDARKKSQEEVKQEDSESTPALKEKVASSNAVKEEVSEEKKTEALSGNTSADIKEKAPVLERGLFYLLARNKVDVEEAESIDDFQRSYLVLQPFASELSPTQYVENEGEKTCRVLIIPKKKLPSASSHQRELAFVDLANQSISDIREKIVKPYSYETKTKGHRTIDPPHPIAEGVYVISKSKDDRSSHFTYIRTFPQDSNEVVEGFNIKEKGSLVVSVRNPKFPPPPQARGIPEPQFSKELQDGFRDLRWTAALPAHFDVQNAQILWIGEKTTFPGPTEGDQKTVEESVDDLESEELGRISDLLEAELDPIYDALEGFKKSRGETLKTSWTV